tara:strand:+ start:1220 stop:1888 length:669 start_codon:yes stop_codon:yes gene_type:complete
VSDFLKNELGDWHELLLPVLNSKEFKEIPKKIAKNHTPQKRNMFKAYNLTQFKDVKVVILGQTPYWEKPDLATGLAFGIPDTELRLTPSLRNIEKEVENSVYNGLRLDFDITLESWAKQGVLLLNTSLTCELGKNNNAHKVLWEPFIARTIEALNNYSTGVIYLLWGDYASSYSEYIYKNSNTILKAPSPSSKDKNNLFLGCNHFKTVNDLLKKINNETIKW